MYLEGVSNQHNVIFKTTRIQYCTVQMKLENL